MQVVDLLNFVRSYRLSCPAYFDGLPPDALGAVYNGVGPDRFPGWLRKACTRILYRMEPLALIHDVEFGYAPRTYWAFTVANLRWAWNALLIAYQTIIMPDRQRFLLVAIACSICCQLGGWRGFRDTEIRCHE